jgi:SAM-dependent methyltransferase
VTLPPATIAVVGAGASRLVDELLALGHRVIAVDLSPAALGALAARIGPSPQLRLQVDDVRTLALGQPVDVWHDRAVFHFLTAPADQQAYVAAASAAVRPGGHLVLAGFAPGGPIECSGLPVVRHDGEALSTLFAPDFELLDSFEADHLTPWGTAQRFLHAVLRRGVPGP